LLERDAGPLYLASLHVHPERLEGGYLGADDDREAADRDFDTPGRPPTVVAIVDPERGFIEQIPGPSMAMRKADG
jgi:hypothetical protein